MAKTRYLGTAPRSFPVRHSSITMDEALRGGSDDTALIRVGNSAPVPTAPDPAKPIQQTADTRLFGASGTPIISGFVTDMQEYLPELRGRNALAIYEKMRRSDADCAAIAAACKLPIRAAEYKIVPGAKDNEPDFAFAKEIADDVTEMLFGGLESTSAAGVNTTQTFESVIENALLCLEYGCSGSEDLWVIDQDKVRLRKIAPRLPLTFYQFPVEEDGETLQAVIQWGYRGSQWVTTAVPAGKFTLFSFRKEGANFYGRSMYREAYQHWYIKQALYRIDSIACERNGMGIPTIIGGEHESTEDKNFADEWLANMSANESTGLHLPFGWDFKLVGVTGREHAILPSIQHNSEMICRSALAMFMTLGTTQTGSRAVGNVMTDFFYLSEEATARFICDTISETSIRRYVDYNYASKAGKPLPYPKLSIPNIAVINPLDIMEAMKDIANSNVDFLQPDDDTENWLRKKIGMPMKSGKGGRTRFGPVTLRVQDEETGTPQDIESGKGKPAAVPGATPPGVTAVKPPVKTKPPSIADQKKKLEKQKAQFREPLEGRLKWHGLDVSIETDRGSTRSGTGKDGKAWAVTMQHPYGYIRMTKGADGDHVDCYMGPDESAKHVYVVHQNEPTTGEYDEDKCMLNFSSPEEAKAAYLAHHSAGAKAFGSMETLSVDNFIAKVLATKDKPGQVQLSDSSGLLTRELFPHEKKHDFSGHAGRQDKTQTAIRRILGGVSPALNREAARRAATLGPSDLGTLSLPVDRSLTARLSKAVDIAHKYGYNQVYAERYRATKRPKTQRVTLSTEESASQDTPNLIAQTAVADLHNGIVSRAKAAHIDAYKRGERDGELEDEIIGALQEMSTGFLDRVAMEAARSGVVGGRYAALRELQGEIKSYARTEAMDQNTCQPCQDGDGEEWDDLDDVTWSSGDDCEGGDACRGQLLPIFSDEGEVQLG